MKNMIIISLLVALAVSQSFKAGGIFRSSGDCFFPNYIEGCFTYLSENQCGVCQYNYVKAGKTCNYSPNPNGLDCCLTFGANNQCSQCKNGLIINPTTRLCVDTKITGCIQKDQTGCVNCAASHDLVGKTCVKKIQGCSQYDNNRRCMACAIGFSLLRDVCSPNAAACTAPFTRVEGVCQISNCRISSQYGCSECSTGFTTVSGSCVAETIRGCAVYSNSQTCLRCDGQNWRLVTGRCQVVGCSNFDGVNCRACSNLGGFRLSSGLCQISNCVYFNDNGCQQCLQGRLPNKAGCVESPTQVAVCLTCRVDEYVGLDNKCYKKQLGCLSYLRGKCSKCDLGYILNELAGICIQRQPGCLYNNQNQCSTCSLPFRMDTATRRCIVEGCRTYSLSGCQSCNSGYSINPLGVCELPFCADIKNGVCAQCVNGYILNRQSQCVQNDVNCLTRNAFSQCLKCAEGYQIGSSGLCVRITLGCNHVDGKCTSCRAPFTFVPTSQTCTIDGCVDYFVGGCQKCASGYSVTYNGCKLPNCLVSRSGVCLQCDPDYVFRSDGSCVNKDEFCNKMDQKGTCVQCMDSYYYSRKLQKCQKRSPGCSYDDNDACVSCREPFTFSNNRCVIDGCLSLGQAGCNSCQYPFVLTKNKLCTLPNCALLKSGKCVACNAGFTQDQKGLCVTQDPNCLNYDNANTFCKKCIKGYRFDENGQCQYADAKCWNFDDAGICENCDRLYFLNQYQKCQIRDPNCLTYINGYCSECRRFFFASNGICMQNLKGCNIQKSYANCVRCDEGFIMNSGKCVASITQLNWNSIDMDFFESDNKQEQEISKNTFTVGITSKVNLSPAIKSGLCTLSYSSRAFKTFELQVDSQGDDGWSTATANSRGEYIQFDMKTMQTFYAIDIKSLNGNQLVEFSLQYSDGGSMYTKVDNFLLNNRVVNYVQTIYFTAFYAKSIRLVVVRGLPNIKVELYYNNKQYFSNEQTPNGTYISDTTVRTIQNAQNGNANNGGIKECSTALCWMGMESCEPKSIKAFVLNYERDDAKLGTVQEFKIDYSVDGITFQCWNGCKAATLTQNCYNFSTPIIAAKFRVHFTKYSGKPKFGIQFTYN